MSKEEIKGMFWLNASRFCDALEDGREVVVMLLAIELSLQEV